MTPRTTAAIGLFALLAVSGCTSSFNANDVTRSLSASPSGAAPNAIFPSPARTTPPDLSSPTLAPTDSTLLPPTDPGAVVHAYYDAINAQDYAQAWRLGGDNLGGSYATFAAGFNDTVSDVLDIIGEAGGTVSVRITALHTDGSQHSYEGTYTFSGSVIVGAHIWLIGQGGGTGAYPLVHPGAFCAPIGAIGVTATGTLMKCTSQPPGTEARWRHE